MNKNDINIKTLLIHVLLGWLIVSQFTLFHIQLGDMQNQANSFTLGMLGGMLGCYLGFTAYRKRWFLKDD